MDTIQQAIVRLHSIGLVAKRNEERGGIVGGTDFEDIGIGVNRTVNGFSILPQDNGWLVRRILGQLPLELEAETLSESVDIVERLYAPYEDLTHDSTAVNKLISLLSGIDLNARFQQESRGAYITGELTGRPESGFSIFRQGGYFVVTTQKQLMSSVLIITDNISEIVDSLQQYYDLSN